MFDLDKPWIAPGALAIFACAVFASPGASANTYSFRVDCKGESYVALWDSGPDDPGQDYFRIATGDRNQDCSIYDYNRRWDHDLPRRWCSGDAGIIRAFPPILIPLGFNHCR
jgi:hypothetical protein